MNSILKLLFLLLLTFQLSCTEEKNISEPHFFLVTTDYVVLDTINSKFNSLNLNVYGSTDQHANIIINYGTCYSEKPNPTVLDKVSGSSSWAATQTNIYKTQNDISNLKPNTLYYLRNFVKTSQGLQYGNQLTFNTAGAVLFGITTKTSKYGVTIVNSTILSNGGMPVISSGVVWSKFKNPTVDLDTKIVQMPDSSNKISGSISGLEIATLYYARSYVINKSGVTYSNEIVFTTPNITKSTSVTDIDGNEYETIQIGNQIWMCQNLRTTRFQNGDVIPTTLPANKNISLESRPIYQWAYNGDETNLEKKGRLYTWYAVTDYRKIAPAGWRVPNVNDFKLLEKYLIENGFNFPEHTGDYADYLGKALSSTTLWDVNNTIGTVGNNSTLNNITGFNAYPVGYKTTNGSFIYAGWTSLFWTSDFYDGNNGYGRQLTADYPDFWDSYSPMEFGCSVRCIKILPSKIDQSSIIKKTNSVQIINNGKSRIK